MALAAVVALLRAAVACTSTPDLDFVPDASIDIGPDAALTDVLGVDGGDGSDDDDAADATSDARVARNTCPDAAPPFVAQCCGRVRCVGKGCDVDRCSDCRLCAASSICCIKKVDAAADCVANLAACR